MSKGSKVFTVLVVGDNPQELIAKYDNNLKVEKYIKYKYLDASNMRANSIKILKEILSDPKKLQLTDFHIQMIKEKLANMEGMTDFEYYRSLTDGLYYDENGDAWSTENPNGKYDTCKVGDNFSLPLILNDGSETRSAKVGDVNWSVVHMANTHVYEIIWDMVKNGREPSNDKERVLYENMMASENYFDSFNDCNEYVTHNCAYWNYAYLDKNGWVDLDDCSNDKEWVATYYDKFISKLSDDETITVFECTRMREE